MTSRAIDLVIGVMLLVTLSPLMLLIAVLIRIEGGAGVILRQRRIGLWGREFAMLKFRTMHRDAEELLERHLACDASARKEWEQHQMLSNDPRVLGPFAEMLRRHSLDELPQLINVLRGEMSLVGPRPLTPEHAFVLDEQTAVLRQCVRPGMTGLWQISGRDRLSLEERWRLDREYVETRSVVRDLRILVKTVGEVVRPVGSGRGVR
jgi:exopolysaccharide production protein ExoY